MSVGTIGLIKAVNTFNVDKGSRLATYMQPDAWKMRDTDASAARQYSKEVSRAHPGRQDETVSLVDVVEMDNKETLDTMIFKTGRKGALPWGL